MTEEEIKLKAEQYATDNYGEYDEHDYTDHSGSNMCHAVSEKAFIAGAHSRDEEIEERKSRYRRLEKSLRGIINGQIKEIDKLRNPWISVEEKPKKTDVYYVRTLQVCADMAYFDSSIEKWEKGRFTDGTVTYWMTIPKV